MEQKSCKIIREKLNEILVMNDYLAYEGYVYKAFFSFNQKITLIKRKSHKFLLHKGVSHGAEIY